MLQKILVGPSGHRFLRDARDAGRAVFVWTVNEPRMMRWSIRAGVDGVITDDLDLFIRVRREYDEQCVKADHWTFRDYLGILSINVLVPFLGVLFRWRYGFRIGFNLTWWSR
jgi:hypothetical protein